MIAAMFVAIAVLFGVFVWEIIQNGKIPVYDYDEYVEDFEAKVAEEKASTVATVAFGWADDCPCIMCWQAPLFTTNDGQIIQAFELSPWWFN